MSITAGVILAFFGVSTPAMLTSTDELGQLKNSLIVDARPLADYQAGHIPGAAHLDVTQLSETRNGVKGLLKPVEQVREALGKAGLAMDKHIVIYSSMKTADDLKDATRLFWILDYLGYPNIAVLDGGFAKWTADKRPTEAGDSPVKAVAPPEVHVQANRLASKEDVQKFLGANAGLLVDQRSKEEFGGEKKAEPVAKPGHIPGAKNVPATSFVQDSDKTLLPGKSLEDLLKGSGMASDKHTITYCNTGRQASVGYFVMRLSGHDNVSLYDGSMAEWTADSSCPVATGTARKKTTATPKEAK
ncbi:MAG: sulfurtransferase [Candidatus Hydrogenedentes bacterium]|nr:sulfurtransferase [Candidatus Hydrogenedentota bacterium]